MDHAHAVLVLKIPAGGEVDQPLPPAVPVTAVCLIVIAKTVGGDILHIDAQGRRIAQIPVGRRHHHRVCGAELAGQVKDRRIPGPHGGQGVPLTEHLRRKGLEFQGSHLHRLQLPVRVGGGKGLQKRRRQAPGAGVRSPLADAAIHK